MRLHDVQVACPPGTEEAARRFYGAGNRAEILASRA